MRTTPAGGARLAPYDRSQGAQTLIHSEAAIGPHALTVRATAAGGGLYYGQIITLTQWIHRVTSAGTLGRARIQISDANGEWWSLMLFNNTVDATAELDLAPAQAILPVTSDSITVSTEDLGAGGTIDYRGNCMIQNLSP